MNQAPIVVSDVGTDQDRTILVVAYILHGLAVVSGLTAIAGVVINHLKVNESGSAFVRSHHSWLIRTFWWGPALGCRLLRPEFRAGGLVRFCRARGMVDLPSGARNPELHRTQAYAGLISFRVW